MNVLLTEYEGKLIHYEKISRGHEMSIFIKKMNIIIGRISRYHNIYKNSDIVL